MNSDLDFDSDTFFIPDKFVEKNYTSRIVNCLIYLEHIKTYRFLRLSVLTSRSRIPTAHSTDIDIDVDTDTNILTLA